MRLKGKTILVTAAGQGIGRATVLAMVNEGAVVWATDINAALLTSYEGMANIHTRTLDVTNKVNIEKVVSGFIKSNGGDDSCLASDYGVSNCCNRC